jgi:hypothetical protein
MAMSSGQVGYETWFERTNLDDTMVPYVRTLGE